MATTRRPPSPRRKKPSFALTPATPAAPAAATESWVYRTDPPDPPRPAAAAVVHEPRPAHVVHVSTAAREDARALEIVNRHALYAAGAGLVPVPVVDFAVVAAIELKMLRELADVYRVPFAPDRARTIVAALIGGYVSSDLGYGAGHAILKAVPVIGQVLGALSMPGMAAGMTWAIGRLFIQHFASGGTLLTFDPSLVHHRPAVHGA